MFERPGGLAGIWGALIREVRKQLLLLERAAVQCAAASAAAGTRCGALQAPAHASPVLASWSGWASCCRSA